jgi:hypothetical protein
MKGGTPSTILKRSVKIPHQWPISLTFDRYAAKQQQNNNQRFFHKLTQGIENCENKKLTSPAFKCQFSPRIYHQTPSRPQVRAPRVLLPRFHPLQNRLSVVNEVFFSTWLD